MRQISSKAYLNEFAEYILEEEPDFVGLSTLDTALINTVILSQAIKEQNQRTKIILGGPGVYYNYSDLMNYFKFIDYCIIGEGEIALEKFIDHSIGNEVIENVPSLVYCRVSSLDP